MAVALLVVIARLAAPFEVGSDQSIQLEAARRLANGLGLTTSHNQPHSPDIAEPLRPRVLANWPPAFSILVAGLLAAGLPLLVSLKALYSGVTIAGWLGWAFLASHFLARPVMFRGRHYGLHVVISILLPVLFTPKWDGSDLFLWAAVPVIILLLTGRLMGNSLLCCVVAGLLFGLACSLRYASGFLGLAAALILLQRTYPDLRDLMKRGLIFGFASLLFLVPTFLHAWLHIGDQLGVPGVAAMFDEEVLTSTDTVWWILRQLPSSSNLIIGGPLLAQAIYRIESGSLQYFLGSLFAIAILAAPLLLLRLQPTDQDRTRNMNLSAALVSASLLLFLCGVGVGSFLSVNRYYTPAALFGPLICYQLVTSPRVTRKLRRIPALVVVLFMAQVVSSIAVTAIPGRRWQAVSEGLSYIPPKQTAVRSTSANVTYPSNIIYSRAESTRRKIVELYHAEPNAVFFAQTYSYLVYDDLAGGPRPGVDLRSFPTPEYWRVAFTSKALKVYWILDWQAELKTVPAASQRVVYEDRYERTRIIETDLPAGYRFFPDSDKIG